MEPKPIPQASALTRNARSAMTDRMVRNVVAIPSPLRLAGDRVSGSRRYTMTRNTSPPRASAPNSSRHEPRVSRAAPSCGASSGPVPTTVISIEKNRAAAGPE